MKIFGKGKKTVKSTPKESGTELVALVTKIAERLDVLERKMDQVIGQTSPRSSDRGGQPRSAPQPVVPSQPPRQPMPSSRPHEVKAIPAGQPQGQAHGRREKVMHKAVCADCHKDCEIPFKPTGERPVYCKDCFSKRKSNKPPQADRGPSVPAPVLPPATQPPSLPQRQVSVTKKGVGKVTVSEIVQPSTRAASPKRKNLPQEKKSKK